MGRGFLDEDDFAGKSDLVDIEVTLIHATEKAYLVRSPDTSVKGVWVPKSLAEYVRHAGVTMDGSYGVLTLSKRIAEEKGLA